MFLKSGANYRNIPDFQSFEIVVLLFGVQKFVHIDVKFVKPLKFGQPERRRPGHGDAHCMIRFRRVAEGFYRLRVNGAFRYFDHFI